MLGRLLKSLLGEGIARARAQQAAKLIARGMRLQQVGEHARACREYERILARAPDHVEANYHLGVAHAQCERYGPAAAHLLKAASLRPEFAAAHVDLGNVYRLQDNAAAAEQSYRKALALAPDAMLAHFNLAQLLLASGRLDEALVHLERAHGLDPAHGDVLRNLVTTLIARERYSDAVSAARQAATGFPANYDAHACLGLALQKSHQVAAALDCYERALAIRGDDADLHNNRGIALQESGRMDEALASYERALDLRPDFPLARFHRALARLMTGDYERGWVDYETRLLSADRPARPIAFPRWHGTPLGGRTLLVYGDQGLGDEIMFASCVPDAMRDAGHCVIECAPKLLALFARSFAGATVYARAPAAPMPAVEGLREVELEVPGSSLPRYYRCARSDFPEHRGYLVADPERARHWGGRLASLGPGLKVGISWRGGTFKTRSPKRSIPLEDWLPILRTPGARFVSLQYTAGAGEELAALRDQHDVGVAHWPEAIDDYDETAALVSALDLTISVCTAVIHLAGALGRAVWIMAPYSPEWRYGFLGERMPWYPSACVIRQRESGDWASVVATVTERLTERSAACAPQHT